MSPQGGFEQAGMQAGLKTHGEHDGAHDATDASESANYDVASRFPTRCCSEFAIQALAHYNSEPSFASFDT